MVYSNIKWWSDSSINGGEKSKNYKLSQGCPKRGQFVPMPFLLQNQDETWPSYIKNAKDSFILESPKAIQEISNSHKVLNEIGTALSAFWDN